MAEIPHLASPFRILGASVVVVEQDSDEDLMRCVQAILRTEIGDRDELPEFGREEMAFTGTDEAMAAAVDAVRLWEPRVEAMATAEIEDMVMNVEMEVE